MTEALPDPLVPSGMVVRDLDGFMLNVERLLASELVAIGSPEECWAALMLWCRAWKQEPGGSLPDDDRILASFSGAGKRWAKVKSVALHGFVKCSDGRLYHRFLCGEVMRASRKQEQYRERREADRKRLSEWRGRQKQNDNDTQSETDNETHFTPPNETGFVALETGTGTGTGTGTVRTDADASVGRGAVAPTTPKPAAGKSNARKTGMPPDWEPDATDRRYAAERGHDERWISDQADRFRNRCLRDRPVYADWNAAWRTWVCNAEEFASRAPQRFNGAGTSSETGPGSFAAAAANVMSRRGLG